MQKRILHPNETARGSRYRTLAGTLALLLVLSGCGTQTTAGTITTPVPVAPATAETSAQTTPVATSGPVAGTTPAPQDTSGPPPGSNATCPNAPGPISGPIVFGSENNIYAVKEDGSGLQQLTNLSDTLWAHEPAWSPDGKTLAFTFDKPSADPMLNWLPVGTICAMDRATGKGRTLAKGAVDTDSLAEADWEPDGKTLLVALHRRQLDNQKQYLGDLTIVARYDLATNKLAELINDAVSPDVSHADKQITYVHLDQQTYDVTLMLADPSGKNTRSLIQSPPQFSSLLTPRWSPDGRQVVFTASGGSPAGGGTADHPVRTIIERLLDIRVAEAHGIPALLWLVDADGKNLHRLSQRGLDDPRAAWSPDSKSLAYATGGGGVTLLNLASNQEHMITQQGNYGGIAWAPN